MKVANKKIAVICMGILLVFALAIGLFTQSIVAQGETAADSQALLAENWMTEGFAPEQTENGLQLKSTARYKNPIDMQSGYLRLELSLDNPDTVDFVFVLSRTDDDAWGWCAEPANGLYLRIMGDAGTILLLLRREGKFLLAQPGMGSHQPAFRRRFADLRDLQKRRKRGDPHQRSEHRRK